MIRPDEYDILIKEIEEHIDRVKTSTPDYQTFYEMGQRHILEIVKEFAEYRRKLKEVQDADK